MKLISFALTTRQILDRTKTVTRRMGWLNLIPGELVQGCKKVMGRRKGEPLEKLAVIRIVSVRREKLRCLTDDLDYGQEELRKEGFDTFKNVGPLVDPTAWVPWFCESHKGCTPETEVTRIEFEYVET